LIGRATTDDHGPAAQLRPITLLDGGKERIEIDVQDASLGHPAIMRHVIRGGAPDQPLGSTTTVTSGVIPARTRIATL